MLGPLGGNKVWSDDDVEAARGEAQKIANASSKTAAEGGYWFGYAHSQSGKYVMEDFDFIDKKTLDHYSKDSTITEMYVAFKQ